MIAGVTWIDVLDVTPHSKGLQFGIEVLATTTDFKFNYLSAVRHNTEVDGCAECCYEDESGLSLCNDSLAPRHDATNCDRDELRRRIHALGSEFSIADSMAMGRRALEGRVRFRRHRRLRSDQPLRQQVAVHSVRLLRPMGR